MVEEAQLDYKGYQFEWGLKCTCCNMFIYLADPGFFQDRFHQVRFLQWLLHDYSYCTFTATLVGFFTSGAGFVCIYFLRMRFLSGCCYKDLARADILQHAIIMEDFQCKVVSTPVRTKISLGHHKLR